MEKQIRIVASDQVMEAVTSLGRTEDVKFSPDSNRLALAGYMAKSCLILDYRLQADESGKTVFLDDYMKLSSPGFNEPHGLDFVEQDTLVVANRSGNVCVVQLPERQAGVTDYTVPVLQTITRANSFHRVRSPGSVAVSAMQNGRYEVLVCNNYVNRVTRHVLDGRPGFRVRRNQIIFEQDLDVPDGIAVCPQGRWIAVSNHNTHSVLIYEKPTFFSRKSKPVAVLSGPSCPHGVRFTPDSSAIVVADAASPLLYVFNRPGAEWLGHMDADHSVQILDKETYLRGRYNPQEGGPKGLDIDPESHVVATTCEEQPLTFFDLPALLQQ
ncbi:MAG: YncE family protein [Alphaproteobacteria bacterium]